MARNAPDPAARRQSSRVTKAPVQRASAPSRPKQQRDRKRFWLQVMVSLLVLAMLLPVIAAFL